MKMQHIDKSAHDLIRFEPQKNTTALERYSVYYHEERLYSVRNNITGIVSLVYANNPYEAAALVNEERSSAPKTMEDALEEAEKLIDCAAASVQKLEDFSESARQMAANELRFARGVVARTAALVTIIMCSEKVMERNKLLESLIHCPTCPEQ